MPLVPPPPAVQQALPPAARDVDYLRGSWQIHHRKLRHRHVLRGCLASFLRPWRGAWKIYWVDSDTGSLCPPVVGGFDGAIGTFFGNDQQESVPLRVRVRWNRADPDVPVWEQAFSADDGATWELNWVMEFRRSG